MKNKINTSKLNEIQINRIMNLIILSNNRIEVLRLLNIVLERSIKDARDTIYTLEYIKDVRLNIMYNVMREIYQNGYTPDINKIFDFINTDFDLVLIENNLLNNNQYNFNIIHDLIIVDRSLTKEELKDKFKYNFISVLKKIEEQVKFKIFNRNTNSCELDYIYKILKKDTLQKCFIERIHVKLLRRLTTKELIILKLLEDNAIFLSENDFT